MATPLRGAWTGNRGILHCGERIVRFHAHEHWLTCALRFKDWWHAQWQPHHFTWLYFHDEAVSLAAGHRPCALCRRASYDAFRTAWSQGLGQAPPSAKAIDHRLHGERIVRGTHRRRTHASRWNDLPNGAFVLLDEAPALVLGDRLVTWSPAGYGGDHPRPRSGSRSARPRVGSRSARPRVGSRSASATVLTPPAILAVLRAGYPVQIDPSARG